MEKVYGGGGVFVAGTAKVFDGEGQASCPHCYGNLLDRSVKTGQWVVQSQDEMASPASASEADAPEGLAQL